jgi:hypothetical protein
MPVATTALVVAIVSENEIEIEIKIKTRIDHVIMKVVKGIETEKEIVIENVIVSEKKKGIGIGIIG